MDDDLGGEGVVAELVGWRAVRRARRDPPRRRSTDHAPRTIHQARPVAAFRQHVVRSREPGVHDRRTWWTRGTSRASSSVAVRPRMSTARRRHSSTRSGCSAVRPCGGEVRAARSRRSDCRRSRRTPRRRDAWPLTLRRPGLHASPTAIRSSSDSRARGGRTARMATEEDSADNRRSHRDRPGMQGGEPSRPWWELH